MSTVIARGMARLWGRADGAGATSGDRGGVPSRIMVPRLIFAGCATGLVLFGLLMIYSSSSILGLTSSGYNNDPSYFLFRQAVTAAAGAVLALILAYVDYHAWRGTALVVVWVLTLLSLLVVYTPVAGHDAYGATRWVAIGPFTLQPSEFAKVCVVLVGANVAYHRFELGSIDDKQTIKLMIVGVVLPLALILFQPDKGTTGVLVLTLLVMAYLSGIPGKKIFLALLAILACAAVIALRDEYSRARIFTALDPFSDEYGSGYQLVQGFYALGSGGIGGVGIGMSRQKYNYLPMAHNDFIFAVIGEELGFVGALLLLAAFILLLWAGFKIAENASDLMGRLIAAGCSSLIIIQLLLNVSGVIGIFPLSGKPVPFISYGGSSIISTLMLVGLVMSVSLHSTLPSTRYDERRAKMRIAGEDDYGSAYGGTSTAGAAMPRSASLAQQRAGHMPNAARASLGDLHREGRTRAVGRSDLRVVDGGMPRRESSTSAADYNSKDARLRRVDLGPSAADRLRNTRKR